MTSILNAGKALSASLGKETSVAESDTYNSKRRRRESLEQPVSNSRREEHQYDVAPPQRVENTPLLAPIADAIYSSSVRSPTTWQYPPVLSDLQCTELSESVPVSRSDSPGETPPTVFASPQVLEAAPEPARSFTSSPSIDAWNTDLMMSVSYPPLHSNSHLFSHHSYSPYHLPQLTPRSSSESVMAAPYASPHLTRGNSLPQKPDLERRQSQKRRLSGARGSHQQGTEGYSPRANSHAFAPVNSIAPRMQPDHAWRSPSLTPHYSTLPSPAPTIAPYATTMPSTLESYSSTSFGYQVPSTPQWVPLHHSASYPPMPHLVTSHSVPEGQQRFENGRYLSERPRPQCWDHGCNGRQFSTFSNLLRHQREKAGVATKSYCPRCGAEFTRTTARNGHMANEKCKTRRSSDVK